MQSNGTVQLPTQAKSALSREKLNRQFTWNEGINEKWYKGVKNQKTLNWYIIWSSDGDWINRTLRLPAIANGLLVCLPDKAGSRTQLQCMSELISSNGNNAWWCQKTSHHGWERNDWKFVTTATVLFSRLS